MEFRRVLFRSDRRRSTDKADRRAALVENGAIDGKAVRAGLGRRRPHVTDGDIGELVAVRQRRQRKGRRGERQAEGGGGHSDTLSTRAHSAGPREPVPRTSTATSTEIGRAHV